MREFKLRTSQRPRPLPTGRWAMTQRWNDLLFAHWRVPGIAGCCAFARRPASGYVPGIGVARRGSVLDGPLNFPWRAVRFLERAAFLN